MRGDDDPRLGARLQLAPEVLECRMPILHAVAFTLPIEVGDHDADRPAHERVAPLVPRELTARQIEVVQRLPAFVLHGKGRGP